MTDQEFAGFEEWFKNEDFCQDYELGAHAKECVHRAYLEGMNVRKNKKENTVNILKILGAVGKGLIKDIIPGYGMAEEVINTINNFLPNNQKLTEHTTGDNALTAINSLSPDKKAELLSKQCDVEIVEAEQWTNVIESLSKADISGSSTRPQIAKMMAYMVCFTVLTLDSAIFYAIVTDKQEILKAIADAWPLILAILGTPTALLRSYFGLRTQDKQMRANTALGVPALPTGGILSMFKNLK